MPKEVFFVVEPDGQVSDTSAAFDRDACQSKYLLEWLPNGAVMTNRVCTALWQSFEQLGYRVKRLEIAEQTEM